jgi:hypothetical protein
MVSWRLFPISAVESQESLATTRSSSNENALIRGAKSDSRGPLDKRKLVAIINKKTVYLLIKVK